MKCKVEIIDDQINNQYRLIQYEWKNPNGGKNQNGTSILLKP